MMVIGGDRQGDRSGGMSLRRLIFAGGFRAMGGWVNVVVRLGLAIDNHFSICPVQLCCLYSNIIS